MADSKVQAFENDAIIQTYFEKLKVLISKKSIFAQQIGLLDVATYLKDMFEEAGAEVVWMIVMQHPLSWLGLRLRFQMRKH